MSNLSEAMKKLTILAESAKFDVSCSSSGADRRNKGSLGSAAKEGICHSWSADGRCISLLKILFTNKCEFDCAYCVNRRSAEVERASFSPRELADLTIEFYRRNYIEGLFLSSAVEVSPDHTAERILEALGILRHEYGFCGYIHAKIIPGVSPELVERIGYLADRLSVNVEVPTRESLALLAPQKKAEKIFAPMKQITGTMIEQKTVVGAGNRFSRLRWREGDEARAVEEKKKAKRFQQGDLSYLSPPPETWADERRMAGEGGLLDAAGLPLAVREKSGGKGYREKFAPAGQTTQMIIGATPESDRQIIKTSERIYRTFFMKRVYFSAYVPVVQSPILPGLFTAPPLTREHRLYQADWLMRFYGFTADEILDDDHPNFDLEVDPKVDWALRNIHLFPIEINRASMEEILRIPGVGNISAARIVRQRRMAAVKFEDLKKMGVVVKRAKYFLTCGGKYYGDFDLAPDRLRGKLAAPAPEDLFRMPAPDGEGSPETEGAKKNTGGRKTSAIAALGIEGRVRPGALSADAVRAKLLPPETEVQLSFFSQPGTSQQISGMAADAGDSAAQPRLAAAADPEPVRDGAGKSR